MLKTSLNYIKLQDTHTRTHAHTAVNSTWLTRVVSILASIIRFWLILSLSFSSTSSHFLCPPLTSSLSLFLSLLTFPVDSFLLSFPLITLSLFFFSSLAFFFFQQQTFSAANIQKWNSPSLSFSLLSFLSVSSFLPSICFSEYGRQSCSSRGGSDLWC